jgi:hypothetical protein
VEHTVDSPEECPFLQEDYDGYPDGCKYDATECIHREEFPEDCPLNSGDITVTKG